MLALLVGAAFWAGRMGRGEKLLRIYRPGEEPISYSTYRYLKGHTKTLSDLTGYSDTVVPLEGSQVVARFVAGDYFGVMGGKALAGRTLTVADESTERAVLSEAVWKRQFGGEPGVVGKRIRIGLKSLEVVGIATLGEADIWIPFDRGGDPAMVLYARTRAGVTAADVQAELSSLLQKWSKVTGSVPVTAL